MWAQATEPGTRLASLLLVKRLEGREAAGSKRSGGPRRWPRRAGSATAITESGISRGDGSGGARRRPAGAPSPVYLERTVTSLGRDGLTQPGRVAGVSSRHRRYPTSSSISRVPAMRVTSSRAASYMHLKRTNAYWVARSVQ